MKNIVNNSIEKQLTVLEVAKQLGVGAETVRRYIREGKLSAKKARIQGLKSVWMVIETDLLSFVKKQNLDIHK